MQLANCTGLRLVYQCYFGVISKEAINTAKGQQRYQSPGADRSDIISVQDRKQHRMRDMHNSRLRTGMFAGHVSRTLDALADRLLCWLVTPREFSYVLAGLSLSPCSPCAARQISKEPKASVGAVRRGEAAFLGVSHDDGKAILRNEQVAPRVGGVDVIAWC